MKMLLAFCLLVLAFLWLPLIGLVSHGWQVSAFLQLLNNAEVIGALVQSIALGLATAMISTFVATLTAFAVPSLGRWGKAMVVIGTALPMVLPEIAFGLAYLVWFTELGILLGWPTLVASHVAFTLCYAILVMKTSVEKIDWQYWEAAQDLGASRVASLRHGVLPQLWPGLLASATLSFALSLDDFLITYFVKGIDQTTLPIKVYSMMRLKVGEEIYALSIVLFLISSFAVVVAQIWYLRSQNSRSAR